jgi:hypothetical protein
MRIKRSTRFNWQRSGILVQGQHYMKVGGKVLYLWHEELPLELAKITNKIRTQKQLIKQVACPTGPNNGPNWDY